MNQLSWMIYLADVADSLQEKLGILGVSLILFGLGRTFVSASSWAGGPLSGPATRCPKLLLDGCALLAVNAIIPQSTTIYAIAASELGETALRSSTGSKAIKALDAWLDKQIAPEPESTK